VMKELTDVSQMSARSGGITGLSYAKEIVDIFYRLSIIQEFIRQIDKQTDHETATSIAIGDFASVVNSSSPKRQMQLK